MDAERLLTGQLRRVALAGNIVAALECLRTTGEQRRTTQLAKN